MKRSFVKPCFVATSLLLACTISLSGLCTAQSRTDRSHREENLKRFLRAYDDASRVDEDRTTRYAAGFVDLNGDGIEEVIVLFISGGWCGSGGCSALILEPQGSSYKIITRTTITHPPIRVLPERTNGWHDLAVTVGGGGILSAYEARLRFNGKKYPSNPTVPPAQRLRTEVKGIVVIPDNTKGTPLYDGQATRP